MKTKLSMKNVFGFGKTHILCVSTRLLFLILALSKAFAKAKAFKAAALCSVLCALSFVPCALSQIPQGFNYQAIARDGTGAILQNTPLQAMLYVQSLSTGGTIFWKELHSSITTNSFGLFTLVVGTGTRQTESTVLTFDLIDWSVTPKYLKTEIFYSGTWKDMGTSQLMTVPYAMASGDLVGTVDKLAVMGTTSALDEALFEVKNKNGQTIFAVYNEGVRIYVDNGAKGPKGGFAVGGFDMTKATKQEYLVVSDDSVRIYVDSNPLTKGKKSGFAVGGYDITKTGTIQNYLDVSADSVRVYIDTNPATKKIKGGFAVGGYDMTKTGPEEYLRVTRDSTRIFVNDQPEKGLKGGFAVGGFDATKGNGVVTDFTSLNPDNYLIGHKSGLALTSGKYNSFLGFETGVENSTGGYNTILGYQAGYKNNADNNVFLGYQSGYNNSGGISNTFLGHLAGYLNSSGRNNVFLGDSSGYGNQTGIQNIFLGNGSGKVNNGNYNAFIGYQAGYKNDGGNNNSFIGYQAGKKTYRGSKNVFIGYQAGYSNVGDFEGSAQAGNNNIYIGDQSGYNNSNGRSNVYIGEKSGAGLNPINAGSPPIYNVYIGYQAGFLEYSGTHNTFIGYQAGYTNNSGNYCTFIGYKAGYSQSTGAYNTFIGYNSGVKHTDGGSNLFMGTWAGFNNLTGTGNVFLGYDAGYYETGSNKLFIDNVRRSNETTARLSSLMYGEFNTTVASQTLTVNAKLGIFRYPVTNALEVNGDASKTTAGTWLANSDSRIKTDIQEITDSYEKVLSLKPVKFRYSDEWILKHPSIKDHFYYNFIAQEYREVFPESVSYSGEYVGNDDEALLQIDTYSSQIVTIQAVKDLIIENRQQQKEIAALRTLSDEKDQRISDLESIVESFSDMNKRIEKIENKLK